MFEKLFRKLCNARPTYLARENDPMQLAGIYEFPREFRKIHWRWYASWWNCAAPARLTVGPFLRGFYFSGVRPIMVNEVAPAAPMAAEPRRAAAAWEQPACSGPRPEWRKRVAPGSAS